MLWSTLKCHFSTPPYHHRKVHSIIDTLNAQNYNYYHVVQNFIFINKNSQKNILLFFNNFKICKTTYSSDLINNEVHLKPTSQQSQLRLFLKIVCLLAVCWLLINFDYTFYMLVIVVWFFSHIFPQFCFFTNILYSEM